MNTILQWVADKCKRLSVGFVIIFTPLIVNGVEQDLARSNRHALIITVGIYSDPLIPALPGTKYDRESATKIAQFMQIPLSNIQYLSDESATGQNIENAIKTLSNKVGDGDKVFIFYSGHGTRYESPLYGTKYQKADTPRCVEALLPYDGSKGAITNREMASLLEPITRKTDKLFVFYDACFSGGIVNTAQTKSRSIKSMSEEFRPKFAVTSDECGQAVNFKTRNLVVEQISSGALPQDIIHLSAAKENEASLDGSAGGLATVTVRDCMLGGAMDLDGSGAISIDEIRVCAQNKIDQGLSGNGSVTPHHLVVNGNAGFIPNWFSRPSPKPPKETQQMTAIENRQTGLNPLLESKPATVTTTVNTPELAVKQIYEQRSGKRQVDVSLNKANLVIGKDVLEFKVKSTRPGYLYVILAGSDGKSLYLLFPNALDKGNKLLANTPRTFPNTKWRIRANGPAGYDKLLFVVADEPRDLSVLGAENNGPFLSTLNDSEGRSKLGKFLTANFNLKNNLCKNSASVGKKPKCSDAFGAALLEVKESNE